MAWLQVEVVEALPTGWGRNAIPAGSTAWVERKGDRVLVYNDRGWINDLSVEDARRCLRYVRRPAGQFVVHPNSPKVAEWYRHEWNKQMY